MWRVSRGRVGSCRSRSSYDFDIAEGVTWAANHGAKIINLSLGGPNDGPVLHDAVTYATGKGSVVVVAAGNKGDNRPQYPAAYPEVLAVGATDAAGNLTDFSSWGDWIDVAAAGYRIFSTDRGGTYAVGYGTSFSAPIASGVAALVRTLYPTLTPAQVISRMKTTARDAGPRGIDPYYGCGVLDAFHAAGVALTTAPMVAFQRAVDPASVTASTVRLVHGRTGATVAATPVYDEATKTVTVRPAAVLQDNTPYRAWWTGFVTARARRPSGFPRRSGRWIWRRRRWAT